MPLYVKSATDVGRQRSVNEDTVADVRLGDEEWLLVVCDGMGGQEGGQLASTTATAHIVRWIEERRDEPEPVPVIRDALLGASEAVAAVAAARGVPSAGSTAVVAWTRGNQVWMGWVGDSRYYRFQGRDINGRSIDHTRVAEMIAHGILNEAEAKAHPDAHILTRALGGGRGLAEAGGPTVWKEPQLLQPGDTLLLCSDGLFDLVTDQEIPEIIADCDLATACSRLISTANDRGGHDNISVIVACWDRVAVPALPPPPPPPPAPLPSLEPRRTLGDDATAVLWTPDGREARAAAPVLPFSRPSESFAAPPTASDSPRAPLKPPGSGRLPAGSRPPRTILPRLIDIGLGAAAGLLFGLVAGFLLADVVKPWIYAATAPPIATAPLPTTPAAAAPGVVPAVESNPAGAAPSANGAAAPEPAPEAGTTAKPARSESPSGPATGNPGSPKGGGSHPPGPVKGPKNGAGG
ncbi:hypothetical protein LBMAG42_56160 [Deltaproteobacteria bacterium]|nr:hypothetical protein LBMAG42_56160 [Deltaproteobacteria bacterium]